MKKILGAVATTTIVAVFGCSSSDETETLKATPTDGPSPSTAPASGDRRGPAPVIGADEEGVKLIPATPEFGGKLGVSSWSLVVAKEGNGRIRALDARGRVLVAAQLRRVKVGDVPVMQLELHRGRLRVDAKGNVLENTLDPLAQRTIDALTGDTKHELANGDVPYDACSDAQFKYMMALLGMAIACAAAAPTVVGAGVCAVAAANAIIAGEALNTACAPKYCHDSWECTDKYGPGYSCSGGGCVQVVTPFPDETTSSSSSGSNGGYGGGGGYGGSSCTSDWSCSLNDYCNMTEGRCMPLGGNGGGGGSSGFYGGGGGGSCWSSFDCPYFASCSEGWCS